MGKRPLFEISISVGTANSGVPMKTTRIVGPHSRKFEITKISFCPKFRTTPKNFISYSQGVEEVSGAALRTASLTFRLAKSIWTVPSGEFGGSFALDLVAFLASDEADRVAFVFGFEPALQGAECDHAARPAETNQEPTKFRGRERVGWALTFAAAAHSSGAVAEACAGCVNAPANCP